MISSSAKTLTVAPGIPGLAGRSSFWIHTCAGPQVGFGHLKRCLVLAQSLADCTAPLFLIDSEDRWSQEQLASQGYDYFCEAFDKAWSLLPEPAAVLIDTRCTKGLDGLLAAARSREVPVISIQDLGLNPLPSDLVIDGSIAPVFHQAFSRNAAVYGGTDFMILDPAYRLLRHQRRPVRKKIQSVLVNLGGGDSRRYFSRVLGGLRLWAHEVEVVGIPGFVPWGQQQLERGDWHPLHFRWEAGSVAQVLFQADLAITAGGLSAYEALCAGAPLLALSYDSLQQSAITAIAAAGGCIDLGPGDALDPVHLAEVLRTVDSGSDQRRLLSVRGRTMVDGRGTERVSRIIRQLVRKRARAGHSRFME